MRRILLYLSLWLSACPLQATEPTRQVVSLNGQWEVAEGGMNTIPALFDHHVPVPGLIDMAEPPFKDVGRKSERRQAFWYRRRFSGPGPLPEMAMLKIHKAKYGTKVWLNGQVVGEHLPCFTPAWLDVRRVFREEGDNELLIRVGADRSVLPQGMPKGFDFEKKLYLPGLYDSVELHLCDAPRIVNVQTVPDIQRRQVRVVVELQAGKLALDAALTAAVHEADGGKPVGLATPPTVALPPFETKTVRFTVPIRDMRLWSPEDPFLYHLKLRTQGDTTTVRFGMRSFHFDPKTKRAMLNGKPYFLRGSNVTLYRFFEDAERGGLPWDPEWVRKLHRKFKTMHWNSLRYCIGFPPEFWYDIADEEGILIQDEFPIWQLMGAPIPETEKPDPIVAERVAPEYTQWMRERWNHPCVVIWDAQNESVTAETGKALRLVRHLDLSNRPWENGWGEPQSPTDCVESHPYLFSREYFGKEPFRMSQMRTISRVPTLLPDQQKTVVPILVNEYGWLWLNRKGEPTTVTHEIYHSQLGEHSTAEERRELWARYLAAQTEFWRAHRQCAGVLHFCSLGYSRRGDIPQPEGGATSDHWVNVSRLEWDPHFERYVRDAFHPVGVMLDFWEEEITAAATQEVAIIVYSDLAEDWQGRVNLRVVGGDTPQKQCDNPLRLSAWGRQQLTIPITLPEQEGEYGLVAELTAEGRVLTSSRRRFRVRAISSH